MCGAAPLEQYNSTQQVLLRRNHVTTSRQLLLRFEFNGATYYSWWFLFVQWTLIQSRYYCNIKLSLKSSSECVCVVLKHSVNWDDFYIWSKFQTAHMHFQQLFILRLLSKYSSFPWPALEVLYAQWGVFFGAHWSIHNMSILRFFVVVNDKMIVHFSRKSTDQ